MGQTTLGKEIERPESQPGRRHYGLATCLREMSGIMMGPVHEQAVHGEVDRPEFAVEFLEDAVRVLPHVPK